jgi:hypothetical protein
MTAARDEGSLMTAPDITTYVEYLHPGSFYPEDTTAVVTERDPARVAREAAADVFAFRFYDVARTVVTIDGEDVTLRSGAVRSSGLYYIDAEQLTSADVAALPGDHSILLANMRGNGWDPILRCRTGNFRPLEDGDVIIGSDGTVRS